MTMDPRTRLKLVTRLAEQPTGQLELFCSSFGLGAAFEAPSKGWGRAKRVGAALAAAQGRGDLATILSAAAEHFGLSEDALGAISSPENASGATAWIEDAPVAASSPETAEGQLRRLAFEAWDVTGEWPVAHVLQRRIERDGGRIDVQLTARGLDRGVGYVEQKHDGRVVLRIGGLARTHGAERYVSAFIAALQLAYRRYRDAETEETPVLSDEALQTELSLDADLRRRLYLLLDGEWFLLEGGQSSPDGWRRDISPNIRFFRDVKTSDEYVRAANELVRPYVASEAGTEARSELRTAFAGKPSVASERGTQIFNTVILGGVAAIGPNASVEVNVTPGDLSSLMRYLEEQGVERPDREELAEAIEADDDEGAKGRPGARVTAWLGRAVMTVAASSARIGEETTAAVIAAAVARYLGLI